MSLVEDPRSASPLESLRDGVSRDAMIGYVLGGALGVLAGVLANAILTAVFLGGALALVLGAVACLLSLIGRLVSWTVWCIRTRDGGP